MADKIYKVISIDLCNQTITATQTDLTHEDISECELWDISYFGEYKISLVNSGSTAKVIDFTEWKKII